MELRYVGFNGEWLMVNHPQIIIIVIVTIAVYHCVFTLIFFKAGCGGFFYNGVVGHIKSVRGRINLFHGNEATSTVLLNFH